MARRFLVLAVAAGLALASANACSSFDEETTPVDPSPTNDAAAIVEGSPSDAPAADAALDAPPSAPCDLSAPFTSVLPIAELNSAAIERGPRLSLDELTIYFHTVNVNTSQQTLRTATRTSIGQPFSLAVDVPLDRAATESYANGFLTRDGLALFVDSPQGSTYGRIWRTSRSATTAPFGIPTLVTLAGTTAQDVEPYLSESELFFTRQIGDALGIFAAALQPGGVAAPVAVEGLRDPAGDAGVYYYSHPVPTHDGRTIYFAQQFNPPTGSYDIWMAERTTASGPFAKPIKVASASSAATDAPGWISADGCRLYLESTRDGSFDLFVATRLPK